MLRSPENIRGLKLWLRKADIAASRHTRNEGVRGSSPRVGSLPLAQSGVLVEADERSPVSDAYINGTSRKFVKSSAQRSAQSNSTTAVCSSHRNEWVELGCADRGDHHVSALRQAGEGDHAGECVPAWLRLHRLRQNADAEAR
jgi:hypothetical protein